MIIVNLKSILEATNGWDEFVRSHPHGCLWHSSAYLKVIAEAFRYIPYYLCAEENGKVVGILPLFAASSLITRQSRLISVPVSSWCGVIGNNSETVSLLITKAQKLADELEVDYLELRQMEKIGQDLAEKKTYVTFRYDLEAGSEVIWKEMNRKTRGSIRKAIKSDLKVEFDCGKVDLFYNIYLKRVRNLGSPPYSREFFIKLENSFGKDALITLVRKDGKIVCACFSIIYKDTLHALLAGVEKKYLPLNPYSLMYWRLIEYACAQKLKWYDFGRSQKGTSSYNFKNNWGFPETQLYYQYYLRKRETMPQLETGSHWTGLFQKTWRMMPMPVVRKIGPWVREQIVV